MIPYGRQDITDDDVLAVEQVLRSDWLTQGPAVPCFERTVADYCCAKHVVAVNSATSALHLACLALDVGPGDWVWTTPITFVATANCALYCGARVDFVDINPTTGNLCPERLAEKLARAKALGTLPKVVIPVHFAGEPCAMAAIHSLSKEYGFRIIEDASHAMGALYQGEPVGTCRFSDITVFSFHPVKIVTTGEGGVAVTNDGEAARRMELLRSHGITRDPTEMSHPPDGPWCYQQIALGFNYRMTDIQAALGVSQLQRLDRYVARRQELAERYDMLLEDLPVTPLTRNVDGTSALHLYVIRIRSASVKTTRAAVFDHLREKGVGVALHYIPVHTQPYYRNVGLGDGKFPEADHYYAEALSLPMYPGLSAEDQSTVALALRSALLA